MVKTPPSNAEPAGWIPGLGAKIPHASQPKNQNIGQKPHCNKFNKDFKNGLHARVRARARTHTHTHTHTHFKKNDTLLLWKLELRLRFFSDFAKELNFFLAFVDIGLSNFWQGEQEQILFKWYFFLKKRQQWNEFYLTFILILTWHFDKGFWGSFLHFSFSVSQFFASFPRQSHILSCKTLREAKSILRVFGFK